MRTADCTANCGWKTAGCTAHCASRSEVGYPSLPWSSTERTAVQRAFPFVPARSRVAPLIDETVAGLYTYTIYIQSIDHISYIYTWLLDTNGTVCCCSLCTAVPPFSPFSLSIYIYTCVCVQYLLQPVVHGCPGYQYAVGFLV